MNYFVYVAGILGVKTNANEFYWSYGTVAPNSSVEEFEKCKFKIFITVCDSDDVFAFDPSVSHLGKYHYFNAYKDESKVYYERSFFGKSKLRYVIEVKGNDIHVNVNKHYMRFVKHRVMGLHSMGYILTDLVSGLLLRNGIATIHCSAVNFGERSIVIFAPPNTGKTLTSIRLCKNDGYNFIAEDFALTDGKNIWSVPWTSTFRYYDEVTESRVDSLVNRLTSALPILELFRLTKNKSIDSFLGIENIKFQSVVTDLVILERGIPNIDKNKREGLRKIINLNRYEFNYHKAPVIVAMDYFNEGFSPEEMYIKEKEILQNLIDRCNFLCISDMDALNYSETIKNELMKQK